MVRAIYFFVFVVDLRFYDGKQSVTKIGEKNKKL